MILRKRFSRIGQTPKHFLNKLSQEQRSNNNLETCFKFSSSSRLRVNLKKGIVSWIRIPLHRVRATRWIPPPGLLVGELAQKWSWTCMETWEARSSINQSAHWNLILTPSVVSVSCQQQIQMARWGTVWWVLQRTAVLNFGMPINSVIIRSSKRQMATQTLSHTLL